MMHGNNMIGQAMTVLKKKRSMRQMLLEWEQNLEVTKSGPLCRYLPVALSQHQFWIYPL